MRAEKSCRISSDDDYDCVDLPAISPVLQAQFQGYRVCGSRDGDSFIDQTRVNIKDGKCPNGTEPCNRNGSPESTICYTRSEHTQKCPVTSVDIVATSQVAGLKAQGYSMISLNSEQVLVYSK